TLLEDDGSVVPSHQLHELADSFVKLRYEIRGHDEDRIYTAFGSEGDVPLGRVAVTCVTGGGCAGCHAGSKGVPASAGREFIQVCTQLVESGCRYPEAHPEGLHVRVVAVLMQG